MMLRTMIVSCLGQYLADEMQAATKKDKDGAFGGGGDYADYGDYGDYGSDDEYGTEDIGNAKKAFGNDIDFGLGAGAGIGADFDVGAFEDFDEDCCDDEGGDFDNFDLQQKKINIEDLLLHSSVAATNEILQDAVRTTIKNLGKQTVQMAIREESGLF